MSNVVLTSVHDNLVNYVLAHGLNPNVVIPLINQAAAEALAGWEVTGVSVTYAESVDPHEAAEETTRQFLAEVQGTGEYSQNVTWSISGNLSAQTVISADGLLTVDAGEFVDENPLAEHIITITAKSVDNQAISGSVSFTCVTGYYSVLYDANGGAGTMTDPSSPYKDGATVTILENAFVAPVGKVFDRWVYDNIDPSVSPEPTLTIGSNLTIYALWKNIYTVNYNANGGTGDAPAEATFDSGTTITVAAANTFTPPTDKLFLGWNTAADGSGVSYDPADEVVIEADTIFYAQWKDTITSVTIINVDNEGSSETTAVQADDFYFYAVVEGVGTTYSRDVTWSMTGHGAGSFISNSGIVTLAAAEFAPPAVDGHTINIIATSVADPTVSDTGVIICEHYGPAT